MNIKVPQELQIAGKTYTIVFVKHLIRDDGDRGKIYWHKQQIQIGDDLEGELRDSTLFHEIIHCFDEHFCGRDNISEPITCGLAEGLFQLFKNLGITLDWSEIKEEK
uniref:Peptidase n=1 Tax=viral metagenome TaxID=1070528 RepID=A0A6H1ZDK6_9ZZZZ